MPGSPYGLKPCVPGAGGAAPHGRAVGVGVPGHPGRGDRLRLGRYTGLEVTAYATWAGTALLLPAIPALMHAWPQAGSRATAAAVFLGLAPSPLGFVAWGYGG